MRLGFDKQQLCSALSGALALPMMLADEVEAQARPVAEDKVVRIVRTTGEPRLDGVLDDAIWAEAAMFDDLHQYEPVDHGVASERTVVYVAYDDDNLYVAARLYDRDPEAITARQMVVGQSLRWDDSFAIYLDPFNNKRTGYMFQVNPNGSRIDGVFETPTDINRDWQGIWYAAARTDADGWVAELTVPFKTLNFDAGSTDWGFTVERTIARKQEEIAWVSFNREVNPGAAGLLSGLEGVHQGLGIDIVPSLVTTEVRDTTAGEDANDVEPSLDVFYKVTPSLTGVLTLNTDFSATEVDDRRINLSRFSLFFPEKRAFFLQDVDIFSFGGLSRNGIPFFSRRIGLSEDGGPIDLKVGAKLTGRVGRWNVGVLDIEQDGIGGIDRSNLFVGRVAANVLRESSVGLILTDGDPRSNLDNSVAGADFRYRNTSLPSGQTLEGEVWYQRSSTEGVVGDDAAWGLRLASPNSEGLHGEIGYSSIEANFNPALGFVNRSDFVRTELGLGYTWWPEHPGVRSINTGFNWENYDKIGGGLESRSLFVELAEIEIGSGHEFSAQLNRDREVLVEPFEIADGISIPVGDYEFTRYGLEFSAPSERVLAPSLELERGDFYGGTIRSAEAGLEWRPGRRFFLGLGYEWHDVDLPAGRFVTRLIQLEANLAFDVHWSWVNRLQYDNESQSVGLNSRLRWNQRAGRDLYVVLNYDFLSPGGAFSRLDGAESQIAIKYTHTFRL